MQAHHSYNIYKCHQIQFHEQIQYYKLESTSKRTTWTGNSWNHTHLDAESVPLFPSLLEVSSFTILVLISSLSLDSSSSSYPSLFQSGSKGEEEREGAIPVSLTLSSRGEIHSVRLFCPFYIAILIVSTDLVNH